MLDATETQMTKTRSFKLKNLLLHPKEHSPAGKLNSALGSGQEYLVIAEARTSSPLTKVKQTLTVPFLLLLQKIITPRGI